MPTSQEEQIAQRRANLEALTALGVDIYPHRFESDETVTDLVGAFGEKTHDDLEAVALEWAARVNSKSPTAQRMLKYAFNLLDDGLVGQQLFAGEATRLAYMTDEAVEGRDQFLEKRHPDWSRFPWFY